MALGRDMARPVGNGQHGDEDVHLGVLGVAVKALSGSAAGKV